MNFKEHFIEIKHFLAPFEKIWSQEVINSYPQSMDYYKDKWSDQLRKLSDTERWSIDSRNSNAPLESGELKEIFDKLRQLEQVPSLKAQELKAYPTWVFMNVKEKKLHEIKQILPIVERIKLEKNLDMAVDIGGGKGHLARILSHYEKLETTTIDSNEQFQSLGKLSSVKYPLPEGAKSIHFYNHLFSDSSQNDKTLNKLFNGNGISLGLHTCGSLSLKHMNMFLNNKNPSLINFGCCYSKLDAQTEVSISKFAKASSPLPINSFALSLATRGHNKISYEEFLFKKQVKQKRYMLHLLMIDDLGFDDFISVGQGNAALYTSKFSHYAKTKLSEIDYDLKITDQQLDEYADCPKRRKLIDKLFQANIIRWQFGRLIELYILLDRCIYLQESGAREVTLGEIFESEISPRNLGIIAHK